MAERPPLSSFQIKKPEDVTQSNNVLPTVTERPPLSSFKKTPLQQQADIFRKSPAAGAVRDILGMKPEASDQPTTGIGSIAKDVFQSTVGSKGAAGFGQQIGKVGMEVFDKLTGRGSRTEQEISMEESRLKLSNTAKDLIDLANKETDPERKRLLLAQANNTLKTAQKISEQKKEIGETYATPRQILGTAANTALTAATAGTRTAAPAIKTGAVEATKAIAPKLAPTVSKVLGYGKDLIPRVAEQAGLGASYKGVSNILEGKKVTEGIGGAAAAGAIFPAAGTAASAAIRPVVSFFGRGRIGGTKIATEAIEAAERLSIEKKDLPLSVQSESPVAAVAESYAAKGIGGGSIVDRINNLKSTLATKIDDMAKGAPSPTDLGKNLEKAANEFKGSYFEEKKALYKEVTKESKNLLYPFEGAKTSSTKRLIKQLMDSEKSALKGYGQSTSPELRFYEQMYKGLSNPKLTVTDVYHMMLKLTEEMKFTNQIKTGDSAKRAAIFEVLEKEFDEVLGNYHPRFKEALQKADAFYKEGITLLNSQYSQAILNNADRPDIIVKSVLPKLQSKEDVAGLYKIIGEKNKPNFQKAVIGELFDRAKGAEGYLKTEGLHRALKQLGGDDLVKEILGPEQYQIIKDLEKVALALGKTDKITQGSQTAFLTRLAVQGGLVGSAITQLLAGDVGGFALSLAPVLGDLALTKFVASDFGRDILVNGLRIAGAQQGAKALQQYEAEWNRPGLKNIYERVFGEQPKGTPTKWKAGLSIEPVGGEIIPKMQVPKPSSMIPKESPKLTSHIKGNIEDFLDYARGNTNKVSKEKGLELEEDASKILEDFGHLLGIKKQPKTRAQLADAVEELLHKKSFDEKMVVKVKPRQVSPTRDEYGRFTGSKVVK